MDAPPRPPSSFEQAYDALTRLLEPDRAFRARMTAELERISRGIDELHGEPVLAEEPVPSAGQPRGETRRVTAPEPPVVLPQRTTHGGPFGPAVRAKLVAEALERRRW